MNGYFVDVDGIRTHVIQEGLGTQAVLLLHGGGVDSAELSWKLTIPALVEKYTVFAPDWPGYGRSVDAPGGMTMQNMVDFCLHLLDKLNLQKVHLVGLSMGGGAALGAALAAPDRVKSLTLVDSYGLADRVPLHLLSYWMIRTPWLTEWSYAWMKHSRIMTKWAMSFIVKRRGSLTPGLVEEVFQVLQDERGWRSFEVFQQDEMSPKGLKTVYMDRLGELKLPVLIIHGEKDSLVPVQAAKQALRCLSNGQLCILKGCGHWPGRDAPQEFNQALLDFLDSH